MRLAGRVASPAVEGVIECHARLKLLEIIGVHARQAKRGGEQTRRFGRKIESGGIRAANKGGAFGVGTFWAVF